MHPYSIDKCAVEADGFSIPLVFVPRVTSDARGMVMQGMQAYLLNPELFPDPNHPAWLDSRVSVAAISISKIVESGAMSIPWLKSEAHALVLSPGRLAAKGHKAKPVQPDEAALGEKLVGLAFTETLELGNVAFPHKEARYGEPYALWGNRAEATYEEELARAADTVKRKLSQLAAQGYLGAGSDLHATLIQLACDLFTAQNAEKYRFRFEDGRSGLYPAPARIEEGA